MKRIILKILIGIALAALIVCGAYFFYCYFDYQKSVGRMKEFEDHYVVKNHISSDASDSHNGDGDSSIQEIDWASLQNEVSNIIGWIEIPGMYISYPIVQGEDNEYYLHHNVDGEESGYGAIFLNCDNQSDFSDTHSIVYGHNMKDGTMFHNLNSYGNPEEFAASPDIYIYTISGKTMRFRIFSVHQAEEGSAAFKYNNPLGSDEYGNQLEVVKNLSEYDTGTVISDKSPFITLITCNSRLDDRIRTTVHAILQEVS